MVNRRTFVKASVGASLVGAGAATAVGVFKPLALTSGASMVRVGYPGAQRVAGPAPRGLPLLPLELDSEGNILGRIVDTPDGLTSLAWYRYCGHEDAPGLDPSQNIGTETVQYFITPDKIAQGFNPWYADLVGDPMNAADFPEPGFGAAGQWRSEGQSGVNVITTIVIATGNDPDNVAGTGKPLGTQGLSADMETLVRQQVEELGFLGFVSFCSHFCCVPGWKEDEGLARSKNAWDALFCTCHLSVYDPATIVQDEFLQVVQEEEA